jgi:dihydropteroate synthase
MIEHWRLPRRTLPFGTLPLLMGIVNVTPDSFSDGGRFIDPQDAVAQGMKLVEEGAAILDIGGESTRPHAKAVSVEEELRRVIPVIEGLRAQTDVPISIDTSKADVAVAALASGAEILNDVTGLTSDPLMVRAALDSGAAVCAMHMRGDPRTMQDRPAYTDAFQEVYDYLAARRDALEDLGIERDRIALDPGIGFGKTLEHNLALLCNADRFLDLGCPILFGHSRKSYIGQLLDDVSPERDRTPATIGTALALACKGVSILRVHDVRAVHDALTLFEASGG